MVNVLDAELINVLDAELIKILAVLKCSASLAWIERSALEMIKLVAEYWIVVTGSKFEAEA